jgi:DNA-directed RNA polymerase specialized sigma24 family protein
MLPVAVKQRKFYALPDSSRRETGGMTTGKLSAQKAGSKKGWALTPEAFQRLLAWLDEGADTGGRKYVEMRRRLVAYFDRKDCAAPDELADETLNRVARRLEEEGVIESETPARYCYIVARFVFMESLREAKKDHALLDAARRQSSPNHLAPSDIDEEHQSRERMLDCLARCTSALETTNRDIITRYYIGKERLKIENRRALAEEMGITVNALSIRACRIRDKLEACVRRCVGGE